MNKIKKEFNLAEFFVGLMLVAWALIIFYPFYNAVLVSFMTQAEYMRNPFSLYIHNPTFAAYKEIFSDSKIFNGYKSTLFVILIYLPASVLFTSSLAYALSRKKFLFRNAINNLVVFTMYFGGGVIPMYLLVRSYGLMGSLWSVVLVGLINVFNMILIKNFFYTIPDSLEESAKLDGANDMVIFIKIYLPLAVPIIATVLLFSAVDKWNEWYYPMLFISDTKKWTLQLVLRDIIGNVSEKINEDTISGTELMKETFALNVQMASVVVTMLPIMLVYPFLQKYFMKGIMIGAVKS